MKSNTKPLIMLLFLNHVKRKWAITAKRLYTIAQGRRAAAQAGKSTHRTTVTLKAFHNSLLVIAALFVKPRWGLVLMGDANPGCALDPSMNSGQASSGRPRHGESSTWALEWNAFGVRLIGRIASGRALSTIPFA
jgi:hypothetical protein